MDIARQYLAKLAHTGQIENALANGIQEKHFFDESLAEIFSYMAEHTRKYKGAPSMEVLRERFPTHNFEVSTDSLNYLSERFTRHVKREYARSSLFDLAGLLDNPEVIDNIDGEILSIARDLSNLIPTSALYKFSDVDERIEKYESGTQKSHGIKMGIPDFDAVTMGIQPHEFVSIVGWQGTGKSTLTQWILFNAWKQGKTAMIFPLEMDAQTLMRKWDTMMMNFEYRALKAQDLAPHEVEQWKTKAEEVKQAKGDILVKDDVRSCTVEYVYAEMMRYKPDIAAIDYISLMDTSRGMGTQMWEKVTYLTQQLKQISRTTGIPIIGVAQTNIGSASDGAKLDNISYSRSIGQDSDIVLGLHQDDEMRENKRMTVRMLKNRDGSPAVADLEWDMEYMKFDPWNEKKFFKNQAKRNELKFDPATGEILEH